MKPPANTILLNFCVIPAQNVAERCVEISRSLESQDMLFVLGNGKFAHMTVYMARFPIDAIKDVIAMAQETFDVTKEAIECTHTGYFMTAGRYLEVSYQRTSNFDALHANLIKAVKDFRANPGNPFEEGYFTPYSPQQRKNAQETGYDLAYDLFRPHITLTRYAEDRAPAELPALSKADLSFNLHELALYEADDNGAVFRKLAEFTI